LTTGAGNIVNFTALDAVTENIIISTFYTHVGVPKGNRTGFDTSQAIPSENFFENVVFELRRRTKMQKVIAAESVCSIAHNAQKLSPAAKNLTYPEIVRRRCCPRHLRLYIKDAAGDEDQQTT